MPEETLPRTLADPHRREGSGPRVAVIGAGPHGLTALKALLAAGIPAEAFERAPDLGGNWNFGGPSSRVYESTHLISSKPFTQFPDFPMPAHYPDYPGHRQVKEYFDSYAEHFGLREAIHFDTDVVSMVAVPLDPTPAGDPRWDLTVRSVDGERTYRYDAVVIANGHNWYPKTPDYPGMAGFQGQVLHSADYKSADQLRGHRVLVVGAGNTGCDIVVEAAQHADRAWHSTRRGYYYNPKYAFGKPSDQVADGLLAARLPLPVRRAMFKATLRATVGDLESFGLRKPDHDFFETHPIVNQQLVYYVGHGDITPKPDVDHFDAAGVVFEDGSRADVDLVIFATGYLAVFPFLADPAALDNADGRPRLGLQMASPEYRNVWVSGLIQPDSGQWTIAHWQGRAIASFLALLERDPQRAEQAHRNVLSERDRVYSGGAEYKDSTRHYYEIAHQDYLQALQQFLDTTSPAGRSPRVLRRWDWSNPPKDVHLEVLSTMPQQAATPERMERPPLLFVPGLGHGAWCFAEHWLDAAAERGFPAYAMSLRGHGGSGGQRRLSRTFMRDYVHDLMAVIAGLPSAPVIVGHSLGALVVQRAMFRYQPRAAVLLTPIPTGGIGPSLLSGARRRPLAAARAAIGGSLRLTADDLFSALPSEEARDYADRLGRESPWAQYAMLRPEPAPPVSAPVLVMGAEDDRVLAQSDVLSCARSFDAPVVWVPGGHDVMLDGGWEFALDTLLDWVDRTCPPGAPVLPGAAPLRSDLSVGVAG